MELYPLIDDIEDLVTSTKKVGASGAARVNKHDLRAIVGQMRGAIPEELKQAHWIVENRDEMLTEARRETERTLEEAREERVRLLGREGIAKGAEQRAQRLLASARAREREIRLGAGDFAGDTLARLETYLTKFRDAVGRGRGRLSERGGDRGVEGEAVAA